MSQTAPFLVDVRLIQKNKLGVVARFETMLFSLDVPEEFHIISNHAQLWFTGELSNMGTFFHLTGTASVVFSMECALCLAHVKKAMEFSVSELFSETQNEDEMWPITNKTIDLQQPFVSAVLSQIPLKVLCKEECLGLCPTCGCDRNKTQCECEKPLANPQFSDLKKWLK